MTKPIELRKKADFPVSDLNIHTYKVPTSQPESDGTFEWDHTIAIVVEIKAANHLGIGLTYGAKSIAELIQNQLKEEVIGKEALNISGIWNSLIQSVRNIGRPGIASMAISAIDFALWDLKAKLLNLPLHHLLGAERNEVPIYGSGGFTSYSLKTLGDQLAGWVDQNIRRVKMKVGRNPDQDPLRVRHARQSIGIDAELFVDANGAYSRKQALVLSKRFSEFNVTWFEEPVSSDDLEGLRFIRNHCPHEIEITAGEYGFDSDYFNRMIQEKAIDVIQIDATRCCGITGFMKALAIAETAHLPVSAHCAPHMHVALGCHSKRIRHLEYFYDHVRIENLLFDGVLTPVQGALRPDPSRPGFGLILKKKEAEKFAA
jgi:L-alanine-DL-glutamate epimerase-like enolase superfamily enzyme